MLSGARDAKSVAISSARETTSDMGALRAYFDTNGDGKLTSADAAFAQFKVLMTNADGSTTVATLAQLGITEINLTEDSTRIELPDGSVIEGQTTYRKFDDLTGTVASTALMAGIGWRGHSRKMRVATGDCAVRFGELRSEDSAKSVRAGLKGGRKLEGLDVGETESPWA